MASIYSEVVEQFAETLKGDGSVADDIVDAIVNELTVGGASGDRLAELIKRSVGKPE